MNDSYGRLPALVDGRTYLLTRPESSGGLLLAGAGIWNCLSLDSFPLLLFHVGNNDGARGKLKHTESDYRAWG